MSIPDILSIIAAFAVTAWFVRTVTDRNRDEERFAEDDARTYFDEHGHWPDETPRQAAARVERAQARERRARADERD
jgi:hypothetical protein